MDVLFADENHWLREENVVMERCAQQSVFVASYHRVTVTCSKKVKTMTL